MATISQQLANSLRLLEQGDVIRICKMVGVGKGVYYAALRKSSIPECTAKEQAILNVILDEVKKKVDYQKSIEKKLKALVKV